jgi:hypothetical protein
LLVRFHFVGLRQHLRGSGGSNEGEQKWELVADGSNDPALIVVEVPTQSIGEEAFFQPVDIPPPTDEDEHEDQPVTDTEEPLRPYLPVGALSGGPTWLVYDVSAEIPIPFNLAGLFLACARGIQIVSAGRKRPPDVFPDQLSMLRSALHEKRVFSRIEAPYRLVLSPAAGTTWWGHALPKANDDGSRIELWHAWMVRDLSRSPPDTGGKLRVVWATDFSEPLLCVGAGPTDEDGFPLPESAPTHFNVPFRMSLDKRDRYELVRLTTEPPPDGAPIEAEQLILSPLGAWLKVSGQWKPPSDLNVREWRHRMTMGRDHFVRVVYRGFLFPLGHEASLTKITERRIEAVPEAVDGKRAAYLRTRMFVVVREPSREYGHNGFPFVRVTLKTLVTPDVDPPVKSQIGEYPQDAFWICSGGEDVQFHVVAEDHEGRQIEFVTPLAFVANHLATQPQAVGDILTQAWSDVLHDGRSRECRLGGQGVAFAPSLRPGDTTLETDSIELDAQLQDGGEPLFVPLVRAAMVDIPAVKQLLGSEPQWAKIEYERAFQHPADGAFGNPAEVFARLVADGGNGLAATFRPEQSGGLVTPNFGIEGLSRRLGPVPTADDLVNGEFNPEEVFGDDVRLLGGIPLSVVANKITKIRFTDAAPSAGRKVPQWMSTVEDGAAVTRYNWHLRKDQADTDTAYLGEIGDTGLFSPELGAELEIVSEVCRPLDGSPGSFRSCGRLTNFHVVLRPEPESRLVDLWFSSMTFVAGSEQKTDVSVDLRGVEFLGPLKFVNALAQVIPLNGFSDPPDLKIDGNGAGLGYSLAIPAVGIGVFSLQHLSLSADFYLPFTGRPTELRLAFCSRENPGQVLVTLFGGGVFFAVRVDTTAVQAVELTLEFGGGLSLNLGVASGAVTVMGGVYYQKSGAQVTLVAYYRVVGELRVLGLISIGAEFYLALEYLVDADMLFGIATLKVKVKIAFFSKTVALEVRKELKGSDPTFRELMAPPDWQAYCEAFGD